MLLHELLDGLPAYELRGSADVEVTGVCFDTRRLRPSDLFVAVPEANRDGHIFIEQAVERGAAAVVAERPPAQPLPVSLVLVPRSKPALADLAATFHDHPSRKLRLIGVTGTDGKTTTCELAAQLLRSGGVPSGFLTTVTLDYGLGAADNRTRQSTLESPDVQAGLASMVEHGCRAAVLESTSHALALDRLRNCAFDTAIVTNVTHEHLDFHRTWEGYLEAKARLLDLVQESRAVKSGRKTVILNRDDRSHQHLTRRVPVDELSYGLSPPADLRAESIEHVPSGSRFLMKSPWGDVAVQTPLVGQFNVYNCLAAAAAALVEGLSLQQVANGLAGARAVAGRMERIDEGQPFQVIVDYAHTADSLEKVLRVLRPGTPGRLLCVFGSAGERDVEKRPAMGAVAARLADYVVITNEDPRFEDAGRILEEIAAGAMAEGRLRGADFECIEDRRQAIAHAFAGATAGDTVLLAGKGHEQCIIVRDEKLPWDDRAVARELLRNLSPPSPVPTDTVGREGSFTGDDRCA